MRAWIFNKTHEPLKLTEVEDPKILPGSVIIDIKATGLCHTDVTILDDPGWMDLVNAPVILGHECAGIIAEVGEGVNNYKVGDRVGVCPVDPDTKVSIGGGINGAYSTKLRIPATELIKLPDNVSFVQGASATDAGMTSHHAIFEVGQAKKDMKVGIIGLGGLGEFGANMAIAEGCNVLVADPKPAAQKIARQLGINKVYKDVLEMKPEKPDLIVDFAGFGTTTANAIKAVRDDGTVVVVGMGKLHADISTADLTTRRLKLLGNNGGTVKDIEKVYQYFNNNNLHPTLNTIDFLNIDQGLDQLRAGEVSGRLIAVLD
ncbi:MAG: alcohol dehydrogenase catalytic domain-containing protein [Lactobacillus sp.]|uniref:alcohol dehydrogenase catalytic domain-containing protein n=1 Tax=Bombilactobacillus bombi TaxID=1303590 RepID=UPI0035EA451C|nr:alcohol dehydrogenase catalytic domain-containing protein [Lactobacillus sp.]